MDELTSKHWAATVLDNLEEKAKPGPKDESTVPSKMKSYFVLNRRGKFKPSKMSGNQCTEPGQTEYFYQIGLVFDGNVKLDENMWIVKHEDIDELVQSVAHKGSCEEMQLRLVKTIVPYLVKKKLPLLAYKSTIKPVDDPDANPGIQFVSLRDDKYAHCLSLL